MMTVGTKFKITPLKPGPVEPKLAEPKADWAEKTHTSWTEHSGFIETSKVANIAPPPRLDPRLVPRPAPPSHGPSPAFKLALTIIVLAIGVCGGLYSSGVLSQLLKRYAPSLVAKIQPTDAPERTPAAATPPAIPPSQH